MHSNALASADYTRTIAALPLSPLNWQPLGLEINGTAASDRAGEAVALSNDGRTLAITAPQHGKHGQVQVYRWNNATWTQAGNNINGESLYDFFGQAAAISADGNTLAIGGIENDGNGNNSGHVRIYRWNVSDWEQVGVDIEGAAANDFAGGSVALAADGKTVAIGALGNDHGGIDSGHVRIFRLDGIAWMPLGTAINGAAAGDGAGIVSISADGNTVAIGAADNDNNGDSSGHVRIYNLQNNTWTQVGNEIQGRAGERVGSTVSLSGNGQTIAVGGRNTSIYRFTNNRWIQASEIVSEGNAQSVSISDDGMTVAIGSRSSARERSQVEVYRFGGNSWAPVGVGLNGITLSGQSVALSADGSTLAIGAPENNNGNVSVYRLETTRIANRTSTSELIARDKVTGELTIAYTDSATQQTTQRALTYGANLSEFAGQSAILGKDWRVSDTADFNGDGIADMLLHNQMGDEAAIWLVDRNGTIRQAASLLQNGMVLRTNNTNWRVIGFADLDRDNTLDLVWHNPVNDAVGIWFMQADGLNVREYDFLREANGQILKTNNTNWRVEGLGDFDGDGNMDLLYRLPESNATAIVQLNGQVVGSYQLIESSRQANLIVDRIIDSDNNGTADIYWYNPDTNQIILQPIAPLNDRWQSTQFKSISNVSSTFQSIFNAQGQIIPFDLNRWELLEIDDFGRLS